MYLNLKTHLRLFQCGTRYLNIPKFSKDFYWDFYVDIDYMLNIALEMDPSLSLSSAA
jgi:hypothetical protein